MSAVIAEETPAGDELAACTTPSAGAPTRTTSTGCAGVDASWLVLCARMGGTLVGLARVVSDGATIASVQDVLVHPDHQRAGIGRSLLDTVVARTEGIRQTVLLTDAEPGQRAFYEASGFTEAHDVEPLPLRAFVRLR